MTIWIGGWELEGWFTRTILDTGRLPLFWFFVAFISGFVFIRFSVRMIRAQVSWWPGNVTPDGLHLHHMVFGVCLTAAGGIAGVAAPAQPIGWRSAAAAVFGIGLALVLDEFALIVYLKDVYWSEEGRASVDAVFVAASCTGLLLLGINPFDLGTSTAPIPGAPGWVVPAAIVAGVLSHLGLAVFTLAKGKYWTAMLGLFIPVLLWVGAVRLAAPKSPWAHLRYPAGSSKRRRAERRDDRIRRPLLRLMDWTQNLIAGRPDQ